MTYPIITVPDNAAIQLEQLGTKLKIWYRNDDNQHMLFKQGRPNTGENWAEKVCCELSELLNLPHAHYEFAKWQDKEGVITKNIRPNKERLILGNELLARINKGYDDSERYQSRQHTVRRVMALLKSPLVKLPIDWTVPNKAIENAADVFVGYLLLDTLVSNQDRHHENWGLVTLSGVLHLAPTFDHASSLGRNETDENRLARLNTQDAGHSVENYVIRAKSALYETPSSRTPLTTLAAFREAAKIRPKSGRYWVETLNNIASADIAAIFTEIPDGKISKAGIEFATKMLEANISRMISNET